MTTRKNISSEYSGDMDFVDIYNSVVQYYCRREINKPNIKPAPDKPVVSKIKQGSSAIADYAKDSASRGIGIPDVLAELDDESTHMGVYGSKDSNLSISHTSIPNNTTKTLDYAMTKASRAAAAGALPPLIIHDDYFSIISDFIISVKSDLEDQQINWIEIL